MWMLYNDVRKFEFGQTKKAQMQFHALVFRQQNCHQALIRSLEASHRTQEAAAFLSTMPNESRSSVNPQ